MTEISITKDEVYPATLDFQQQWHPVSNYIYEHHPCYIFIFHIIRTFAA